MSRTLAIAICGSGGAGVVACGELLLRAWARAGGLGFLRKAFGPQIRGGESAALLRLGEDESYLPAPAVDLLLALDWSRFDRFADELTLGPGTTVLCPDDGDVPETVQASGAWLVPLPFGPAVAAAHPEGRGNMFALGLLGQLLALDAAALQALATARLAGKAAVYREAAAACIAAGAAWPLAVSVDAPARPGGERWLLTGNQAAGYGALQAGVRFVAAYPITPASDVLEYLAGALEAVGGQLVQAEDELAAINMVIGAGFGGVPAMTATSGPGMALMSESMGLAVASETAAVVVDVMRGGPSTGIPTKSEQSDLNLALYGLHGDAPHIVLAAQSIADCHFTIAWAVHLATRLQTLVIVLSDQSLGQSIQVFDALPEECPQAVVERTALAEPYLRYRDTASGVSPLALPGEPDHMPFTADGLEHSENAIPSPRSSDHRIQLDKRLRKLNGFDFGEHWAEFAGRKDAHTLVICMGSVTACALEAQDLLTAGGHAIAVLSLRLLAPLPLDRLAPLLEHAGRRLVVEHNHGAQLWHYLRSELPQFALDSLALPGPAPIQAVDIIAALEIADVA